MDIVDFGAAQYTQFKRNYYQNVLYKSIIIEIDNFV